MQIVDEGMYGSVPTHHFRMVRLDHEVFVWGVSAAAVAETEAHFTGGYVGWPRLGGRKPNALVDEPLTQDLMVPNEIYVLTKRFTSKEEARRVVAVVCDPSRLPRGFDKLGIENHVNYYHAQGTGLPKVLAIGLAVFLNSTLVDQFFRQFNGHTQVNAGDLRRLRYPVREALLAMGRAICGSFPSQERIDEIVEEALCP